jgi:hypothetical protein
MKLFYSIISQKDQPQDDPLYSLGGFCSSTPIPSGKVNSLFGTISERTIDKRESQYICLILRNTFLTAVTGAALWLVSDITNQGLFKVALALPLNGEFESVTSSFSRPLYAEFNSADGSEDSIALPNMEPGAELAVWLERTINLELEEVKKRNDPDFLFLNKDIELDTVEKLNLKIQW